MLSIKYECPDLEPILRPTCGCLIYQEQIMWILQVLGGFSTDQSDICRRALAKKQYSVIDKMRRQFVEGAVSTVSGYFTNRIYEDEANAIYDRLCEEAPYCFNKSHAAAFSLMIYDMAWLKYHFRPEFQDVIKKYKGLKSDILS